MMDGGGGGVCKNNPSLDVVGWYDWYSVLFLWKPIIIIYKMYRLRILIHFIFRIIVSHCRDSWTDIDRDCFCNIIITVIVADDDILIASALMSE